MASANSKILHYCKCHRYNNEGCPTKDKEYEEYPTKDKEYEGCHTTDKAHMISKIATLLAIMSAFDEPQKNNVDYYLIGKIAQKQLQILKEQLR